MTWLYLYYTFLALIILVEIVVTIHLWLNQRRLDRQFDAWKVSQTELYREMPNELQKMTAKDGVS
jgi:hypothetical protein